MGCQNITMAINRSLARGLDILVLFNSTTSSLAVTEISKQLKYSQSRTYRLIRTLIKYGFLKENPGTAQYSLGLSAIRIGLLAQQSLNLLVVSRPLMKELSLLTRETVLLTAVNGTQAICLERVESVEPVWYMSLPAGESRQLHCGASNKILMAYLPEEEWDTIIAKEGLNRYTSNTITDVDQLKANLKEILKKGYAYSDQEAVREVRAVSAPIFNGLGQLVAGLSVAAPVYRFNKKKIKSVTKLVVEYANKISDRLSGYGPEPQKKAPISRSSIMKTLVVKKTS